MLETTVLGLFIQYHNRNHYVVLGKFESEEKDFHLLVFMAE